MGEFMKVWILIGIAVFVAVLFLITRGKSRAVAADINGVVDSIRKLLDSDYMKMGFLIISGGGKDQFVQFSREKDGLMLWWPNVKVQQANIEKLKPVLNAIGYSGTVKADAEVNTETLANLSYKEYVQLSDGVYANVGHDSGEILELVKRVFKEVFGYYDFDNMKVQLSVNG